MKYIYLVVALVCLTFFSKAQSPDQMLMSFERDTLPNGIVLTYDEPLTFSKDKPLKLVVYALPNGSTMAMGYGKQARTDDPPVYESQHIGAQTRFLRQLDTLHTYVVVYVENGLKSWPAWVRTYAAEEPQQQIAAAVGKIRTRYQALNPALSLTCHSGGGRFIFSFLESQATVPEDIRQIVFLDANYGYEAAQHLPKLRDWLHKGSNHLQVISYNDSVVMYQGKPLVSPTGGTWYRSKRMIEDLELIKNKEDGILSYYRNNILSTGHAEVILIDNPEGLIYHSVLVERNGFIHSILNGTEFHDPDRFWNKRSYDEFVLRGLPARPEQARPTSELAEIWTGATADLREDQIEAEIIKGNFPDFMRQLEQIDIRIPPLQETGPGSVRQDRVASYWVMPDYLMVGDDLDFLRLPMRPNTAQHLADQFGFFLSTAKIADDVYRAASVKLEPQPLTEEREAFTSFIHHHNLIEAQRQGRKGLIGGIKKDVISTPRLFQTDRPNREALYGWHKPDGRPIQPIYLGHVDHYVDYSHGFRLVWQYIRVDNKYLHYTEVLKDPELRQILTNEGNAHHFKYPVNKD